MFSLTEAREKAFTYRKIARDGGDPLADLRQQQAIPTFKTAAETVHREHAVGWKNTKHAAEWRTTLKNYVFTGIGSQRVDQIGSGDVLKVLTLIWLSKPETARRSASESVPSLIGRRHPAFGARAIRSKV